MGSEQGQMAYLDGYWMAALGLERTSQISSHSSTLHRGLFNITQPSLGHHSIHVVNPYNTAQQSVAKLMGTGSHVNTIHTALNSTHWLCLVPSNQSTSVPSWMAKECQTGKVPQQQPSVYYAPAGDEPTPSPMGRRHHDVRDFWNWVGST